MSRRLEQERINILNDEGHTVRFTRELRVDSTKGIFALTIPLYWHVETQRGITVGDSRIQSKEERKRGGGTRYILQHKDIKLLRLHWSLVAEYMKALQTVTRAVILVRYSGKIERGTLDDDQSDLAKALGVYRTSGHSFFDNKNEITFTFQVAEERTTGDKVTYYAASVNDDGTISPQLDKSMAIYNAVVIDFTPDVYARLAKVRSLLQHLVLEMADLFGDKGDPERLAEFLESGRLLSSSILTTKP